MIQLVLLLIKYGVPAACGFGLIFIHWLTSALIAAYVAPILGGENKAPMETTRS